MQNMHNNNHPATKRSSLSLNPGGKLVSHLSGSALLGCKHGCACTRSINTALKRIHPETVRLKSSSHVIAASVSSALWMCVFYGCCTTRSCDSNYSQNLHSLYLCCLCVCWYVFDCDNHIPPFTTIILIISRPQKWPPQPANQPLTSFLPQCNESLCLSSQTLKSFGNADRGFCSFIGVVFLQWMSHS